MTIHQDHCEGGWRVVCDRCGERKDLEAGLEDNLPTAVLEVQMLGWRHHKPTKVRFPTGLAEHLVQTYENDLCPDCQSDEGRPKPVTRKAPLPKTGLVRDAFANDPCDEWPKQLVWAALGLRTDCGHPVHPNLARCPICEGDYVRSYGGAHR